MIKKNIQAIILAAGKSSRFKTGKTKLLEKLCEQEMILYPIKLFKNMQIQTTVVVGFQSDQIIDCVQQQHKDVSFAHQKKQCGTGDALLSAKEHWNSDHLLIMNGDMPLVSHKTIDELYEKHNKEDAVISFVTAHNCDDEAAHYGRVIKKASSLSIIEAKEFTGDKANNCSVNAGIYLIKKNFLEQSIKKLQKSSITHEWYITDLIKIASDQKLPITTVEVPFDSIRGINNFKELWESEQIIKSQIIQFWMSEGVRFLNPLTTHIDQNVSIGAGSSIQSHVHITGHTSIGRNCTIEPFSIIKDSIIGNNTIIHSHSIVKNSAIENNGHIGPYAHIKQESIIKSNSVVGNFVEVKNSVIGEKSKTKHLTYIGDSTLGEAVNVGAGTVICNYDGKHKHQTTIEDKVFIGSNSTLIAPLHIEKNSFIAAGSTITDDIPQDTLAIARQRQTNKVNYLHKKNSKTKDKKHHFVGATKSHNFENNT